AHDDPDLLGAVRPQPLEHTAREEHVGARQHREPDHVYVLLDRRPHDLDRRPLEPRVDDLDPRVAERLRHDLRSAVVAVEPRLGDQDFHSIESRWAGAFGGWPATRCAPAAFRMSPLIPAKGLMFRT